MIVDFRGWKTVRKWSAISLYHMLTGENDVVEDMLLYKVYEKYRHHWISVLLENLFVVICSYDHVLNRRRLKFGTSCTYVIDDLEWFVEFRYWLSHSYLRWHCTHARGWKHPLALFSQNFQFFFKDFNV